MSSVNIKTFIKEQGKVRRYFKAQISKNEFKNRRREDENHLSCIGYRQVKDQATTWTVSQVQLVAT